MDDNPENTKMDIGQNKMEITDAKSIDDTVPEITETDSSESASNVYSYGYEKLKTGLEFGSQKAKELMESPYGQVLTTSVVKTLNVVDEYVDHYLPGDENLAEGSTTSDDTLMGSVQKLSTKVSRRVKQAGVGQLDQLHKRTTETLSQLNIVLDLVEKTRSSLSSTNQKVNKKLADAYSKGYELWLELNKEIPTENEIDETGKTLEQKSLALARMLIQKLMSVYKTTSQSVFSISSSVQKSLSMAQIQTSELYQEIAKLTTVEDVTNTLVNQVQEKSKLIQETVKSLRDQVVKEKQSETMDDADNDTKMDFTAKADE